jgi:thymidylate synthase
MCELIIACNNLNGIGLRGRLPWDNKEELSLFKENTLHSVLIVGRRTAETLPNLPNRVVFVVSKRQTGVYFKSVESAIKKARALYPNKTIFIAGGGEIYKYVMSVIPHMITKIHVSHINNNALCDTFFNMTDYLKNGWVLESQKLYNSFVYQKWKRDSNIDTMIGREWDIKIESEETQYLSLLREIMREGEVRDTRNGETKSLFGKSLKFDLRNGFPLLTTKKMFLRGIVEELLFFIRGDTNTKTLEEKGVKIWTGNTNREFLDKNGFRNREEGLLGPLYGFQWRFFGSRYDEKTGDHLDKGYDQLQYVVNTIKTDPTSRRIIMTDYNPSQASEGVLYPCHSLIIQFYVSGPYLDMSCYNRSQDVFLGTPFNIASSALFLSLISKITGLLPRFLHMTLGDVHIYRQHYDAVSFQMERKPFRFPILVIKKEVSNITDLEKLQGNDITVERYDSHPPIKAEMVA